MITFIAGAVLGFGLCWLRLRAVVKQLRAVTHHCEVSGTALKQSSELLKVSASIIEKQQAVIDLKEPAPKGGAFLVN